MGLPHLEEVQLQHNQFKRLPRILFKSQAVLKQIRLDSLNIKKLPSNLLEKQKNLEQVTIADNEFERIPEAITRHKHDLVKLDISHNPLMSLPEELPHSEYIILDESLHYLSGEDLHKLVLEYQHDSQFLGSIREHPNLKEKTKGFIKMVLS